MAEVFFYQTFSHLQDKPIFQILEKIYASQKRCRLLLDSKERLDYFDSYLWTYSSAQFLPHGREDAYAHRHPIVLTDELKPSLSSTDFLLITTQTLLPFEIIQNHERCLDFFSNLPEACEKASLRMNTYLEYGISVTYWVQNEQGSWNKGENPQNLLKVS